MPEIHRENVAKAAEAAATLREKLAIAGGSSFAEEIEAYVAEARSLLPYRETGKHNLMMGYELIRGTLLELSRRWDIGNDIFFLQLGELEQFETRTAELHGEIARRKTRWKSVHRIELPDVIDSEHLDNFGVPQVFENATEWRSDPAFSASNGSSFAVNCQITGKTGETGYPWTASFTTQSGDISAFVGQPRLGRNTRAYLPYMRRRRTQFCGTETFWHRRSSRNRRRFSAFEIAS